MNSSTYEMKYFEKCNAKRSLKKSFMKKKKFCKKKKLWEKTKKVRIFSKKKYGKNKKSFMEKIKFSKKVLNWSGNCAGRNFPNESHIGYISFFYDEPATLRGLDFYLILINWFSGITGWCF